MRLAPDPAPRYSVSPSMRHQIEEFLIPHPSSQPPGRPRTRRPLLGPLGLSVGLHGLALGIAVWLVGAATEPAGPQDQVLDVAAFVEVHSFDDEGEEREEPLVEDTALPTLPEEILDPSELPEPTETTDDELPPFELVEAPIEEVSRPLEIPLTAVPPRVAPKAAPAPLPPPPTVQTPRRESTTQSAPRPAPRPRRARPAARAAPLRVQSRPNVLTYYPIEARRRGIEGKAVVLITVDRRGVVVDAQVLESTGSALLDRQAVRYLYDTRFQPGAGGKTKAPVHFRLR